MHASTTSVLTMPRSHRMIVHLQALAATLLVAVLVSGCATLAPSPVEPRLDRADARHLLLRTGFAPTAAEVESFTGLPRSVAVDRLLAATRTSPTVAPPAGLVESTAPYPGPRATAEDRAAFTRAQAREGLRLREWWMEEMLTTPSPLTERMTLFWHNHFVSAQAKVRLVRLLAEQNLTLRTHAVGRFDRLLHAIARDPAMVVYLDSAQNRRTAPNENFAREVMELFTLGEGHYTEQDVKEAARAFTGWGLDRNSGRFVFRAGQHDDGTKTIFGRSGRFDGDDVLDLLLARPETSRFVVTKLWREFVSPDPRPEAIDRIAQAFRESGYDIKVALRGLFLAEDFFAAANRSALVKSPVELVVGTLRQLGLAPSDALPFAILAAGMGQNLFAPPNVKGWPGGETWINSSTLLARKQFLARVATDANPPARGSDAMKEVPAAVALIPDAENADPQIAQRERGQRYARRVDAGLRGLHFDAGRWLEGLPPRAPDPRVAAEHVLLGGEPLAPVDRTLPAGRYLRALLLDAAYQLK